MRKLGKYRSPLSLGLALILILVAALPASAASGCANPESGHVPNYFYFDQCGNIHLNGGSLYDSGNNSLFSGATLTLAADATPASLAGATGTAANTELTVTGGVGGTSSNASGTGGQGGGVSITTGAGGVASGATAGTGGAAGDFNVTTAVGGNPTGVGTDVGGRGGNLTFVLGAGAAPSAGSNTGGAGGVYSVTTGAAGAAGNANGGDATFTLGAGSGTGTSGLLKAKESGLTTAVAVPIYSYVNFNQGNCGGTSAGSYVVWTAPNTGETWKVAAFSASFSTASSSGTLDAQIDTGTTAPGSGTTQLTGTASLAGTANTTVNGVIIASPTAIAAGNRITLKTGGTLTGLAGCNATLALQKAS